MTRGAINISIYGKRSSGKSRLMNNVIGQDVSVVSKVKGTTTDPVSKEVEFGNLGHVVFTDTAGIDDYGVVGAQRVKKTMETLEYTDLALYVMDSEDIDEREYRKFSDELNRCEIPHILVFNKVDKVPEANVSPYRKKYRDALFMSAKNFDDILKLKKRIEFELFDLEPERGFFEGLIEERDEILIVMPEEPPKSKHAIVQAMNMAEEAIYEGAVLTIVKGTELSSISDRLHSFSLVIADDLAYGHVGEKVPKHKKLTTFSMLYLKKRGELRYFVDSVKKFDRLKDESKVLIYDITDGSGKCREEEVEIISKTMFDCGKKRLSYEHRCGADFPEELVSYDFIVCSCIYAEKSKVLKKIIKKARNADIPMTSYTVMDMYISGELGRVIDFL